MFEKSLSSLPSALRRCVRQVWQFPWRWLVLAVAVTTALGSVIQTQINLAAIEAMGVPLSWALRLQTTAQDLVGSTAALGGVVAGAMLCALPVASWMARRVQPLPAPLVYAVAAAVGLGLAFQLADALAPMPTLFAATRSVTGTACMLVSAVVGGGLFGVLRARRARGAE